MRLALSLTIIFDGHLVCEGFRFSICRMNGARGAKWDEIRDTNICPATP